MEVDFKDKKTMYFVFEDNFDELFIFNAIKFAQTILREQSKDAKKYSKQMSKKMKKILSKIDKNEFLIKKQDKGPKYYEVDSEELLILFDNLIFIVKHLEKDSKNNEERKKSYEHILNVVEQIVEFIKEKKKKEESN